MLNRTYIIKSIMNFDFVKAEIVRFVSVPHANLYALLNPVRLTFDRLTVLWLNFFLLDLSLSLVRCSLCIDSSHVLTLSLSLVRCSHYIDSSLVLTFIYLSYIKENNLNIMISNEI